MRLFDLFKNISYQLVQGDDKDIENLSIDSRSIKKNTLFFCIKGFNFNTHNFIYDCVKNGATAIVIEDYLNDYPNAAIIKVNNVREVLSQVASNFYGNPWKNFDLIGITGTNGKSSTSYFLEGILKEFGHKTGIIGTVETKAGDKIIDITSKTSTTPDAIELQQIFKKMNEMNLDSVVMEVSSHALALNKVYGVDFKVGIFTNLTQDHLDFHVTMENYIKEKAKLFKLCNWGIINTDSDASAYIIANSNCKMLTYSINNESDLQAINIKYSNNKARFDIEYDNQLETFEILIPGKFSIYNSLAAIGAALAMDVPLNIIKRGLKNTKQISGRIQSIENDKGISVIVDYAHTPDGILNIISSVREFTEGKIITVFGCGGDRDNSKRSIMGKVAGELSDYCFITSDNPRTEQPESIINEIEVGILETNCPYEKVVDREIAINLAVNYAQKGDAVIIAGKGHEKYQIFSDKTIFFDDCEVVLEALESLN